MTNKQIEKKVKELEAKMESMVDLMLNLAQSIPTKEVKQEATGVIQINLPPDIEKGLPIPSKWRQKINEILGEDFEAEAEESGVDYILKVYIPPHLDRRIGADKNSGRDLSVGLIRRATDVADVEKWTRLIKANIQKTYPNFAL